MTALEKKQIQKLIVNGYDFHRGWIFVLTVDDSKDARKFLCGLVERKWITTAADSRDDVRQMSDGGCCAASIAFTYQGLTKLGLPVRHLEVFQDRTRAFVEGAYMRASDRLADTGASAAEQWLPRFRPAVADVLLSIHADKADTLKNATRELREIGGAVGLSGWESPFEGSHLGHTEEDRKKRTAHFGLRDGISQPEIKGFQPQVKDAGERQPQAEPILHEPGEFLLGYANDSGFNHWLLTTEAEIAGFFRNASFGAFRKMKQDQRAFEEFLVEQAQNHGVTAAYLKAKLSGRWDDGRVVKRGQKAAAIPPSGVECSPSSAELNDFDFSDDPDAEGCPFGSHIRRMNPRADRVVPFRRRRVLRRGIPYGPLYTEKADEERGMLGLFFCASLEDQFEHLLAEWGDSNPMGPNNRGNAKDPLVGNHDNPGAVFDIPNPDEQCKVDGFTPFVTTRGTLYAFYPSLDALSAIASISPSKRDVTRTPPPKQAAPKS